MARCFRRQVEIDGPPARVWQTLTNWPEAHRWMTSAERIELQGPLAIGSRLAFRARGNDYESEITDVEQERRLALRSEQGGMTADYVYALEPRTGGGTALALEARCRARGALWILLSPFIRLAIRMVDRGQLKRIKRIVEEPSHG